MAFKMQLTDGATTIDIIEADDSVVGYHIQTDSYTPSINRRNTSGFGSTYLPVQENFTIAIVGSDANDVHVKLAALVNLIDNVRLWFDSNAAAADAINFIYKPTGSTEAVDYRSLVVGNATVNYSQFIERIGAWIRMPNISVSFMRKEWLGAAVPAVSSAIIQPAVLQATFGSAAALPSPVDIEFSSPFGGTSTVGDRHAIISPIDITYLEAESQTGVGIGGVSSVAIAGASGGAVASFDATTTAVKTIHHQFALPADPFLYDNFSVWATVRNPSTGTPINWEIETTHEIGSGAVAHRLSTNTIIVESGSIFPRIVLLGSFFLRDSFGSDISNQLRLNVTNDVTDGSGSGDLEIDVIVVNNLDTDADGYFGLSRATPDGRWGTDGGVLSEISGIVFNEDTAIPENVPASFVGQARQKTIGLDVYGLFLDVTDTTTGWITPGSVGARTYTLTATRRLASLTPK